MTVAALLGELRRRDIEVWVDGDQLRCNAPVGVLTPDLRDVLRQRKDDMIQFLRSAESFAGQQRGIVPLQPRGERTPIFAVPGHNGDVFLYRWLVQQLRDDQPFFGLQPPGLDDGEPLTSVEELAAYFVEQIREFRPEGPYALAGYCAGATIAYEVARQLVSRGAEVRFVAMFAGAFPRSYHRLPQLIERCELRLRRVQKHLRALTSQSLRESRKYIGERWNRIVENRHTTEERAILETRARLMRITAAAVARYEPAAFSCRICLVFPSHGCVPHRSMLQWHEITSNIEEYYGPDGCEGDVMLLEPYARAAADLLVACRDRRKS